jgi:hypothetical protein
MNCFRKAIISLAYARKRGGRCKCFDGNRLRQFSRQNGLKKVTSLDSLFSHKSPFLDVWGAFRGLITAAAGRLEMNFLRGGHIATLTSLALRVGRGAARCREMPR